MATKLHRGRFTKGFIGKRRVFNCCVCGKEIMVSSRNTRRVTCAEKSCQRSYLKAKLAVSDKPYHEHYCEEFDIWYIRFNKKAKYDITKTFVNNSVQIDYDTNGNVIGLEIFDMKYRMKKYKLEDGNRERTNNKRN